MTVNDLTPQEKQLMLQMIDRGPISGMQAMQVALGLAAKLQRSLTTQDGETQQDEAA